MSAGINSEKWPEMRMTHLGMLQDVIARMASNSAAVKTYCISIVAALIGLSAAITNAEIMYYSVPIIMILGGLDAQYLRLEKAFRSQYNSVRREPLDKEPDFLITPSFVAGNGLWAVFWSWSVWLFYLPLIITAVVVGKLIG